MEKNKNGNGWHEWSKHVLKELERMNNNYELLNNKIDSIRADLREDIFNVKNEITKLKVLESDTSDIKRWKENYENEAVLKTVKELKHWKEEMDDVMPLSQMKNCIDSINKLKTFKTQVVTIFLVIQAIIGIAITLFKIF